MEKKIENRIRKHMEIPECVETKWGVVVEMKQGEQSYRPALIFSCEGHTAFIDILHDTIRTPRSVKGFEVKVLPADVTVDGELLLLNSDEGSYRTTLTMQRVETLYFNKVYTPKLGRHIAAGKMVM